MSELHTQFQENIEQSDPLRLATKTIAIYQDSLSMVEVMIKQTEKLIAKLLPHAIADKNSAMADRQAANG